jgi:hypothetical protein
MPVRSKASLKTGEEAMTARESSEHQTFLVVTFHTYQEAFKSEEKPAHCPHKEYIETSSYQTVVNAY